MGAPIIFRLQMKETEFGIIILGAPGAGKGTHCEWISRDYKLKHLSTGELLRAEVAKGTELGKKVGEKMRNAQLVDDDEVTAVLKENLPEDGKFLLDGFPRTHNQAKNLDLSKINIDLVLLLECPDDVIVERICGRWTHTKSGRTYHEKFKPPLRMIRDKNNKVIAAYDDETGDELIQREDDNEVTVKGRLAIFHEQI